MTRNLVSSYRDSGPTTRLYVVPRRESSESKSCETVNTLDGADTGKAQTTWSWSRLGCVHWLPSQQYGTTMNDRCCDPLLFNHLSMYRWLFSRGVCTTQEVVDGICQKDIICANIDDAFILPPQKWPVFLVLQKVGLEQKHAGNNAAGNE